MTGNWRIWPPTVNYVWPGGPAQPGYEEAFMKTMLVYSSRTGNTKKVAEEIRATLPAEAAFFNVEQAPEPGDCNLLILGFWVDKGRADNLMLNYFQKVRGKQVAFFFTLGDYPTGPHAAQVAADTQKVLEKNSNRVLGYFPCQGRVDPVFLERLKLTLPPDHPHALMTPERKARLEEAAKHPNDDDLKEAAKFIKGFLDKIG
jgi:flavodoxin